MALVPRDLLVADSQRFGELVLRHAQRDPQRDQRLARGPLWYRAQVAGSEPGVTLDVCGELPLRHLARTDGLLDLVLAKAHAPELGAQQRQGGGFILKPAAGFVVLQVVQQHRTSMSAGFGKTGGTGSRR